MHQEENYLKGYSDLVPPSGWEKIYFSSPEDAKLAKLFALQGTFGLFDFGWILKKHLAEYGEKPTPEDFCKALKRTVDGALEVEREGALRDVLSKRKLELTDSLASILPFTLAGQVLANKDRILALRAAKTGDIAKIAELLLKGERVRGISYDPKTAELVIRSDKGGWSNRRFKKTVKSSKRVC